MNQSEVVMTGDHGLLESYSVNLNYRAEDDNNFITDSPDKFL